MTIYFCGSCFDNFDRLTVTETFSGTSGIIVRCPICRKDCEATWPNDPYDTNAYSIKEMLEVLEEIKEDAKREYDLVVKETDYNIEKVKEIKKRKSNG